MTESHLTNESLRRFLERRTTNEDENLLLLHLLEVCPACYEVGGSVLDLYRAGALDLNFCTLDIELAKSRAEASALLEKLERFDFPKQRGLIRDTERFRSWGLCELLCERSVAVAPADAARAVEYAELAVMVSSLLREWQPAEEAWLAELRAYAWAHLGNARRVLGELRSAADAFRTADGWWLAGEKWAGDALGYGSRIMDLKASLRIAERRFPEALALLDQALGEGTSPTVRGRILLKKAKALEESGELESSIAALNEASAVVELSNDLHLLLCLRQNLLDNLTKADRFDEAAMLLPELILLGESHGGELDRIRLRWTEARIAAGGGEIARAIELLEEVKGAFEVRQVVYDAALVALELATLYAESGRLEEAKRLALQITPLFAAADVGREALGALALFDHATRSEELTAAHLRQLARSLARAYRLTMP